MMMTQTCVASLLLTLTAAMVRAGDIEFSDLAQVSPMPAWAVGQAVRTPAFDVRPGFEQPPAGRRKVQSIITFRNKAGFVMYTVAALALASGLAAGDGPVDFPPNPIKKPGWILTVNDEFDAPELNTGLWIPYYFEYRTERERAAARYELRDGHLVLRIDQDQPTYTKSTKMKVSSVQTGQRDRLHKPQLHHSTPTEMKFTQHTATSRYGQRPTNNPATTPRSGRWAYAMNRGRSPRLISRNSPATAVRALPSASSICTAGATAPCKTR